MTTSSNPRSPEARAARPLKLVLPSNWEPDLAARVQGPRSHSVYARLAVDFVGGGRSPVLLPSVGWRRAREHIRECHDAGLQFNYVLNAPGLDNQEFTRSGHRRLRRLLERIDEAGADEVTVTTPFLLEFVRRHHSRLKVSVSTFAGVDTPQRARRWQDLGADCITLSVTRVGRSFKTIAAIRRAVDIDLQVIGNLLCVHQCPYDDYHALIEGHASQSGHRLDGFIIDYCRLHCIREAMVDPSHFVRATWIRPEDQQVYADAGIDRLKLVNRVMPTDQIGFIADAYRAGRFDGNLLDLLGFPPKRTVGAWGLRALWRQFRYFFRPHLVNVFKLRRMASPIVRTEGFRLDNRALDGFVDHFLKSDCAERACPDCRYCHDVAARVLQVDPGMQEIVARHSGQVLDGLVGGDLFRYDVAGTLAGPRTDPEPAPAPPADEVRRDPVG